MFVCFGLCLVMARVVVCPWCGVVQVITASRVFRCRSCGRSRSLRHVKVLFAGSVEDCRRIAKLVKAKKYKEMGRTLGYVVASSLRKL